MANMHRFVGCTPEDLVQERNDTSDTSDVATWENSTSPDFCNLRYIDTVNASEPSSLDQLGARKEE